MHYYIGFYMLQNCIGEDGYCLIISFDAYFSHNMNMFVYIHIT